MAPAQQRPAELGGGAPSPRGEAEPGDEWGESSDEDADAESSEDSVAGGARLAELSARAEEAVVAQLSGPPGDEEARWRAAQVRRSLARGCTSLRSDFWASCSELPRRSACYGHLKEHQRVAVRWLMALHDTTPGMVLADEMGLGKTLEVLCFLEALASPRPSLILAPASLLDNWEAEARRWTPALRVLKYHATAAASRQALRARFFQLDSGFHLVIATLQSLQSREDRRHFFRRAAFEYVVCDEAHGLKRACTRSHRCFARALRCRRRLLVTGTPVQNSLEELATLLGLALAAPGSRGCLRASCGLPAAAGARPRAGRCPLRQLQKLARPFVLRRLKAEVLTTELPAKRGEVVYCELQGGQRALYDEEMAASQKSFLKTGNVMEAFWRLRRVCLHPLLCNRAMDPADFSELVTALTERRADFQRLPRQRVEAEVERWSAFERHRAAVDGGLDEKFRVSGNEVCDAAKTKALLRILERQAASGQKTVVFSQFTQLLDVTEAALHLAGLGFCRMDGNTAVHDRQDLVSAFQGGAPSVFLISTKTGGVGLNLTSASAAVMLDLDFNPQTTRQAEDRVHRLGQTRDVTIYYLVCPGTVEEMVLRKNLSKLELDGHFGGELTTFARAASASGASVAPSLAPCEHDGPAMEESCRRLVSAQLRQLLHTEGIDLLEVLPEDVPVDHVAHRRVTYDTRDARWQFNFGTGLGRVHFQVTVKQAGSHEAAGVLARCCFLKFEEGWPLERVRRFRQEHLEALLRHRASFQAEGAGAAPAGPCSPRGRGAEGGPGGREASRAPRLGGGRARPPAGPEGGAAGGASDTSTECALLPRAARARRSPRGTKRRPGCGGPARPTGPRRAGGAPRPPRCGGLDSDTSTECVVLLPAKAMGLA
ncbi:unnamed protein product [Prorocentrum cordatum]|uniref:Uncharacterized protein n=1 Tax=Prorocentrum cordatum TaxID=2364126 RepID=A0ABN9UTR2_9DINO|nr:unnamed protein product [Polarella glacialis]